MEQICLPRPEALHQQQQAQGARKKLSLWMKAQLAAAVPLLQQQLQQVVQLEELQQLGHLQAKESSSLS